MVTRALIMVHGAGRNADHYFSTALTAAFLAGALENTVIVAPRFNRWPARLDDLSGYTAGMTADQLGAKHKTIIVPECGHNDRCVFTTDVVLPRFGGATPARCAERSIMPRPGSRRRKHA